MKLLIDNSVAGGMIGLGRAGQEAQVREARVLAASGMHEMLVPAPAVAELLAWLAPHEREAAIVRLVALPRLRVIPFDLTAARTAAELVVSKSKNRASQKVKVDVQIVACGVGAEADGFCTFDDQFAPILKNLKGSAARVGGPREFVPASAFAVQEAIPFKG